MKILFIKQAINGYLKAFIQKNTIIFRRIKNRKSLDNKFAIRYITKTYFFLKLLYLFIIDKKTVYKYEFYITNKYAVYIHTYIYITKLYNI